MISNAYALTDEPTLIVAADNQNRYVYIQIVGNATAYIGGANVTDTTGLPYEKHSSPHTVLVPLGETLYAVCAEGETEDIRVLRPNAD